MTITTVCSFALLVGGSGLLGQDALARKSSYWPVVIEKDFAAGVAGKTSEQPGIRKYLPRLQ